MAIEIHIFENGSEDETARKVMLDMQVASPAIAAMNLRALAAELERQAAPSESPAGNYGAGQPRPRKTRSDAGKTRGAAPIAPAPVPVLTSVSPFAAPSDPAQP